MEGGGTAEQGRRRVALVELYGYGHHLSYAWRLTEGLQRLGVAVTLVGSDELRGVPADQLIIIRDCARLKEQRGTRRQWTAFALYRRAISRAAALDPTHIHFLYADWHVTAIAIAWALCKPRAKPILTVHWATGVGGGSGERGRPIRHVTHRACLRWLVKRCGGRALVHDRSVAAALEGIIETRATAIIPYPVQELPEVAPSEKRSFRESLNLTSTDKLVLCFGGTRFEKGADMAVEVLAHLPGRFHLLCAGKPVDFAADYLRQKAQELLSEQRLHLIPRFVSDDETALILRASDIALFPYRKAFSGISGPLTQAAGVGKTIVTADIPALADLVRCYRMGVVFPAEDLGGMAEAIVRAESWTVDEKRVTSFLTEHAPTAFSARVYEAYYGRAPGAIDGAGCS